jgi:carbamoyltransferase
MKVLAISPLDKDATVSLLENGRVLFAAGEERFTRKKLQEGFPTTSLQTALDYTGTKVEEIELVVYPFLDWRREGELLSRNVHDEQRFLKSVAPGSVRARLDEALARVPARKTPIPGLQDPNERVDKSLLHRLFYGMAGSESRLSRSMAKRGSRQWRRQALADHRAWAVELETHLEKWGLVRRLKRFEHHQSHAAGAFFASPYERALIVTLDGYGSGLAGSVSIGEGTRIRPLHRVEYPHSLGTFYESVTSSLGFKPNRHEGKIVGLAAYGDPAVLEEVVLGRFRREAGGFKILESNNVYFSRHLASLFPKVDVAAAYQRVLEVVATAYVRHYVERTGIGTIVAAGGVLANVKLNQRLLEISGVERVFVYPNMGDGGCGTGAALLASRSFLAERPAYQSVYFGPDYSDEIVASELRAAGLEFSHVIPIEPTVAQLIHEGRVVARFAGRMEYGPRALGNRSILYRATEPEVNQWLNQRLGRTEFMPFAPATLFEERHRCYEQVEGGQFAAQFMTITFDCTPFMKRACPAAVHVDGTARPQLVREDANPSFYRVIAEYHRLSGIPCVINTSFNMHEEPIVNSPADAIRAFLQGNLDYLAINDFLVRHPALRERRDQSPHAARETASRL